MSYCSRCHREFPLDVLHINSKGKNRNYYYCRSCSTKRRKEHRNTPKGQRLAREAVYRSIAKHPERQEARYELNKALHRGDLLKAEICEHASCWEQKIEAHHFDYKKPLEVIWLCRKHHSDVHRQVLIKERTI